MSAPLRIVEFGLLVSVAKALLLDSGDAIARTNPVNTIKAAGITVDFVFITFTKNIKYKEIYAQ
jgi:hypothetical protein